MEPRLSVDMFNISSNYFTGCLGGLGWCSFHWEAPYGCRARFSVWLGNNECRCVSPKPCVMYGSYISVSRTVSEYLNLNSVVSHGVLCIHANEHIAVYPPVQPYTSTTNHVTISARWLYGDHLEQVGTSLNAFINVQPRIYFIALYVNLVELCQIFYNSYHTYEFFQIKRPKKKKWWLSGLDVATRSRNVMDFISVFSIVFLHFYCLFLLNLT